jgi:hypothetical protein
MDKFSKEEIGIIKYCIAICALVAFLAYNLGYENGESGADEKVLEGATISSCLGNYCYINSPTGNEYEVACASWATCFLKDK